MLYIALAIVAVILLGIAIWYFTRGDSSKSTEVSITKEAVGKVQTMSDELKNLTEESFENPQRVERNETKKTAMQPGQRNSGKKLKNKKNKSEQNLFIGLNIDEIFQFLDTILIRSLRERTTKINNMTKTSKDTSSDVKNIMEINTFVAQILFYTEVIMYDTYDAIIDELSKNVVDVDVVNIRWKEFVNNFYIETQNTLNKLDTNTRKIISNLKKRKIDDVVRFMGVEVQEFVRYTLETQHQSQNSSPKRRSPALSTSTKTDYGTSPSQPMPSPGYGPSPSGMPMSMPSPVPAPYPGGNISSSQSMGVTIV